MDDVVWVYWRDSEDQRRPPLIEACLDSIVRHSQCDVRVCDPDDAFALLPDLPAAFARLIPAHQADVFRVGVLARHGGMYLDADTIVLRSLRPYFGWLDDVDYVGMDWKPAHRNRREWAELGVGVMGPAQPGLRFLTTAFAEQVRLLRRHAARMERGRYPFAWERLLRKIVVPAFKDDRPAARLVDGAATWGALVGGSEWRGGDIGDPLAPLEATGPLPDSPLFTLAFSLLPEDVARADMETLMRGDSVLAHLLRQARGGQLSA